VDWFNHPRYAAERSRVVDFLRRKEYRFRKLEKVIFLCGGYRSNPRDHLAEHLKRRFDDTRIFYAEAVWDILATRPANALQVEKQLADLADIVIIVVESPGTFAELGAFTLSDPLRHKLLPILERKYKEAASFVNTGPVRWVDTDSTFAPSIWVSHTRILEASAEIEERISRIPEPKTASFKDFAESPKHLVFFICDLTAIFGPCPLDHISRIANELLPAGANPLDAALYVALAKAMGILRSFPFEGEEYYYQPIKNGRLRAFQERRRYFDLPTLRAQVLAAMQSCKLCVPVLNELRKHV
jgi:hypothetical protein